MKLGFSDRLSIALKSIRALSDFKPDIAIVAGTGLAGLLSEIEIETTIPYSQITGFPVSTAPSHKGELILGRIGTTKIVAQNGRFHIYEGWESDDIALPVYVLNGLGASTFIVTNAAGALNTKYAVTDIMAIKDHINFMGVHPLTGPNDDELGVRFPDLSRAYCPRLLKAANETAATLRLDLQNGIYASTQGPEFETSAERRFLIMAGGDAVGMSTVPEVICANHCGMKVLGFSAITNAADGGEDQQPDSLEEVVENANIAAVKIRKLILAMISNGSFNQD